MAEVWPPVFSATSSFLVVEIPEDEHPSLEVIICMTQQTCRLLCHLSIVPESTALNSRPKLVILEFYRRPDYWDSVKFIVTYQLMILFSKDNFCVSYASVLENEAVP